MPVNKRYFIDLMKDRSLSMREVARRMDTWPGGLSRALDGKRKIPLEEAAGLARVLGVPLAEVMVNAGIDEAATIGRRCHIIGHAVEAAVVNPLPAGVIERIPVPDMLDDNVVAVQFHTAETSQAYSDGWVTFFGAEVLPSDNVGHYCLSDVEGEGWVLGTVRKGYTSGKFNIYSPFRPVSTNLNVNWTRRALMTLH